MSMHLNSSETYHARILEGLSLTVDKRVIHFLSYYSNDGFARFQLMELLGIKESTLCGTLNELELKLNLLEEVGTIRSKYNRPNKVYKWVTDIKKEPLQKQLIFAI
jgi:hypothetical protein